MGTGILVPRVKRPGLEADHSPPSSNILRVSGATSLLPHVMTMIIIIIIMTITVLL
jgi:hypothetical protein